MTGDGSRRTLSPYAISLLAGGLAGTTVDLSLYPLDTLKTRLQSASGFAASGGFRGIYAGVGSALVGSAPGAALFFVSYEACKDALQPHATSDSGEAGAHLLAASVGEIAACAVRVPTEVIKQRAQAAEAPSSMAALRNILDSRRTVGLTGVWRGLYRGWGITVFREVPFTMIQFPLWEWLKKQQCRRVSRPPTSPATASESAVFGCISGAVAAAASTPLDVLKTRMMLSKERQRLLVLSATIAREEGMHAFFKGMVPRIAWISVGGAVFLGSYQWTSNLLKTLG
ncbi:MAG: S-adenosylmethionine transporter [Chrysothrix sp. TS-e1954]|nr:MAG: S-adenosylmethionine transporter [Chrysothrix sp. TS-e1954]